MLELALEYYLTLLVPLLKHLDSYLEKNALAHVQLVGPALKKQYVAHL